MWEAEIRKIMAPGLSRQKKKMVWKTPISKEKSWVWKCVPVILTITESIE
jgi:hypothetical protein